MIIYSVTIVLDAALEADWLDWMKNVHIPEVLQTGCFVRCRMYRVVEPPGSEPGFVMQYECLSLAEYHRYREEFAPALQQKHTARYAGRFRGERRVLEEMLIQDAGEA